MVKSSTYQTALSRTFGAYLVFGESPQVQAEDIIVRCQQEQPLLPEVGGEVNDPLLGEVSDPVCVKVHQSEAVFVSH